jgi:carboxylate-amine ligase
MPSAQHDDLPFGIEEEFALLDPVELALIDRIDDIMARVPILARGEIKPDVHACIVECSTGICHSPEEAFADLLALRRTVHGIAGELGIALATLGLHPHDDWRTHRINPNPRYQRLLAGGALVPNSVVYGLHVHVGVPDQHERIKVNNDLRSMVPLLIALAASSPVRDSMTGLASFRMDTYANCLTVGLPPRLGSFADVDAYIATRAVRGISVEKDLYWDVRPRRLLPTVEVRCMDSQNSIIRALGLALLVRALVWKSLRGEKSYLGECREDEIPLNRRRAIADGLSSRFNVAGNEIPTASLVAGLTAYLADLPWANHPALKLVLEEGAAIRNEGTRHLGRFIAASGDARSLLQELVQEFTTQLRDLHLLKQV